MEKSDVDRDAEAKFDIVYGMARLGIDVALGEGRTDFELPKVTHVDFVGPDGRLLAMSAAVECCLSFQDDGQTLKVLVKPSARG